MPYNDTGLAHAGSAEQLASMMYDEPAGTLARTMPRFLVSSNAVSGLTTGGAVNLRSIALPAGLVVSNIMILFGGTAAVGPTHFWLGLLDIQQNVLVTSADQGAAAQTNATPAKLPMLQPYVVSQSGLYYVAVSSSAATTAPTLCGNTPAGGNPGILPVLCATAGNQAAPPAVGSQLNGGANTPGVNSSFAAWIS